MINGRKSTDFFQAHGVKINHTQSKLLINVPSMRTVLKAWQDGPKLGLIGGYSQETMERTQTREDTHFVGATINQIKKAVDGDFDTSNFKKAQKSLSGFIAKIQAMDVLRANIRRRTTSEYDGDFDFDRLYDRKPFNSTYKENSGALQTIKVTVDISFNCDVNAKDISSYGATAWALVDLLEKAGIQVDLIGRFGASTTERKLPGITPSTPNYTQKIIDVQLKKAGEYIDLLSLARAFTPWFFRTCIFALETVISDSVGRDTEYSLGSAINTRPSASYGEINLNTEICQGGAPNLEMLESFIKTALVRPIGG